MTLHKHPHTLTVLVLIFLSLLLFFFAIIAPVNSFDFAITRTIQSAQTPLLTTIMVFISVFGEPELLIAGTCGMMLIFIIAKEYREAKYLLLTLAAYPISVFIKFMIDRPRPITVHVPQLGISLYDPSFPSAHVLHYTIFFGFLLIVLAHSNRLPGVIRFPLMIVSALLIVFIPISRIYLGAHWFTDTLGGYTVGLLMLYILYHYYWTERTTSRRK